MIDSPISGMPLSDMSGGSPPDRRGLPSAKRPGIEHEVPQCKRLKKGHHKWRRKKNSQNSFRPKLRPKSKKGIRTTLEAPFNSTQFIMNEHDIFSESDLGGILRPRRQRDSSLSMESEDPEDDFQSSPEEEEFITQQFWSAYEDFHAERLDSMSKAQLVQEYFSLEERLNCLERELMAAREEDRRMTREASPLDDEDDDELLPMGEIRVDAETAAKIEVFRSEIEKLESENKKLKEENSKLRRKSCRRCIALSANGGRIPSDFSRSSSSSSSSSDSEDNLSEKRQTKCLSDDDLTEKEEALLQSGPAPTDRLKGLHHFVSDSGIASSSSGDDLKMEAIRKGTKSRSPEVLVTN